MLACFPYPYPDELLYSVIARYDVRLGHCSTPLLERMVFGDWLSRAPELPTSLEHLAAQLPPGLPDTADTLIQQHTLFPYYAPFLPRERMLTILAAMKTPASHHPIYLVGGSTSSFRVSTLRFCPVCAAEERQRAGVCYWHRLHQLTSVCVCPDHQVFLEDSGIDAKKQNPWRYVAADEVIADVPPRPLNTADPHHHMLLNLAMDTAWLLEHPEWRPGRAELHSRYMHLLVQQGYASYTRRIRWEPLVEALEQHYPPALIALFWEPDSRGHVHWARLLRHAHTSVTDPYLHLLLMRFLGHTPQTIPEPPEHYHLPFGAGPWPCLNPVCPSYHHLVIEHCAVSIQQDKTRRPVGVFACTCGFTYRRHGPEQSPDECWQYTSIVAYGHVWDDWLRERWDDPNVLLKELARQLGIHPDAVRSQAYRLGCQFPRPGGRTTEPTQILVSPQPEDSSKVEQMREAWRQIAARDPERSVRQLSAEERRVYEWLLHHDRAWFEQSKEVLSFANKPRSLPRNGWDERDATYASQVSEIADDMRRCWPPVRASREAILRQLGASNTIRRNPSKLPKTVAALDEHSESQDACFQRKIWTAAEQCWQKQLRVPRYQFMLTAHIAVRQYHSQHKEMIDAALRYIETGDEQLKPPEFRSNPDQAVLVEP
jgi:hypothetical protein